MVLNPKMINYIIKTEQTFGPKASLIFYNNIIVYKSKVYGPVAQLGRALEKL
jgi:hypothetical protein